MTPQERTALNAFLAEHLILAGAAPCTCRGIAAQRYGAHALGCPQRREIRDYTSWEGAGLVIEKMRERGWRVEVRSVEGGVSPGRGIAEFSRSFDEYASKAADTLPEAIALAAQAALLATTGGA